MLTNFLDPWPHQTIDDFYDDTLFREMKKELIEFSKGKIQSNYTKFDYILENFSEVLPHTVKCIKSNIISEENLKGFPHHRAYKNLKLKTQVIVCLNDVEYRIHDETRDKILSVVTYITPEKSIGTLIYDKNKQFVKEVEWKPNRTLIFAGIENTTWHNYKSEKGNYRITLNSFLIDTTNDSYT